MRTTSIILRFVIAERGDRGATSVEYALIASLIAVVVIVSVVLLGSNLFGLFDEAASSYSGAS